MLKKTWLFLEKSHLSWIMALLSASAIFYISSISISGAGKPGVFSYLYHFIAFFWLAFFLIAFFSKGERKIFLLPAVLLSLAYAASDEFHQLFVPFRACSFQDFLMDSAGILLAGAIYLIRIKKKYVHVPMTSLNIISLKERGLSEQE